MMLVDEFKIATAILAHLNPDMGLVSARLEDMRSGFPTSTVGASNTASGAVSVLDTDDENEDGPVHWTSTERAAIDLVNGTDKVACDAQEIRELVAQVIAAVRRLDTLCGPYRHRHTTARSQALTEAPSDWCTSCYRDGQHHTPVSVKKDGTAYYTGMCRWCGDFHKAHEIVPPMAVLRAHHEGRRITEAMVERATRKGKA